VKISAKIGLITQKQAEIEPISFVENWGEPKTELALALAPLKSRDSVEWTVEKAVELGATALYFPRTDRSERSRFNPERLEKIMREALKQCKRSCMPILDTQLDWRFFLQQIAPRYSLRLLAACSATQTPLTDWAVASKTESTLIAIGPEGDFTVSETEAAVSAGFRLISLGNTRLRAETAAVAALSWVSMNRVGH
jgi:16S rRNA (uracil1498-N3)-methyltransferase